MSLVKVLANINKQFGDNTVILGSEIREDYMSRMPSGSLALDVVLGGGWPANQWHEIVGEASNGKTAIALKTIAANQKRDPNFTTVWIAAEQWVPAYAEMCGVDVSRIYVVSTNVMEEAYSVAINLVETKEVDCVVIDSLPALVPTTEEEKDMDEATVGRGALLTGKFFRKVEHVGKRSMVEKERPFIGIIINQYRMSIGVMYGDPRTTPGGKAKDYFFFTRLEVKRDEWLEEGTGQEKRRIGQTIKIRSLKNKSAPISEPAFVDFYFAEGGIVPAGHYDFAKEIVALGILNKVIVRAGAYYRYSGKQWQGADAMLDSIREDIDLRENLERDVLESVKVGSKHVAELENAN